MNISDSYIYKLRFYCSRPHMGLKEKCENGFNKDTMKTYCKLENYHNHIEVRGDRG